MLVSPILSRFRGYYQRKAASLVFRRPFVISPTRPLISFTFDDFPRSALLAGGAILNRFGVAGTYYVSLGLLGKNEPSGKMFLVLSWWWPDAQCRANRSQSIVGLFLGEKST